MIAARSANIAAIHAGVYMLDAWDGLLHADLQCVQNVLLLCMGFTQCSYTRQLHNA